MGCEGLGLRRVLGRKQMWIRIKQLRSSNFYSFMDMIWAKRVGTFNKLLFATEESA